MTLEQLIGKLEKDFGLPEGLCFLMSLMQRVDAPRGSILLDTSTKPSGVFFVASGNIELIYAGLQGEVGMCWITPGNVLIPGVVRRQGTSLLREAVSLEDSVLYYISQANFEMLYGMYGAFWDMMLVLRTRNWRVTRNMWVWKPAA
jgi:CRP-like cAMP-binding protein